ncbi:hypothetical protein ACKWTF_001539 [Chironomus riparius]
MIKNMKIIILICIMSCIYTQACIPHPDRSNGMLQLCRSGNQCTTHFGSSQACTHSNPTSLGPFTIAYTTSNLFQCRVFSQTGCSGSSRIIDHNWTVVGFNVVSFTCPWLCF